jgi:hypothetical protein
MSPCNEDGLYTDVQQLTLAVLPMLTAPLSLLGSILLVYRIFPGRNKKTTYNRLLLAMAVVDIVSSTNLSLSTLLVPSDTYARLFLRQRQCRNLERRRLPSDVWNSLSPLLGLSVYLIFAVIYLEKSESFILRNMEPFMHGVAVGVPLTMAVYALSKDLFIPSYVDAMWMPSGGGLVNCRTAARQIRTWTANEEQVRPRWPAFCPFL